MKLTIGDQRDFCAKGMSSISPCLLIMVHHIVSRFKVPEPFHGVIEQTPAPRLTSERKFQELLESVGHAPIPEHPPPQPVIPMPSQEQEIEDEEKEEVEEKPEKPPVDLFKAIFEDDSSDDEDEDEGMFIDPRQRWHFANLDFFDR